jgi:hypothetical protein
MLYLSLVMHISTVDVTSLCSYYWHRGRQGDWDDGLRRSHSPVLRMCDWSTVDQTNAVEAKLCTLVTQVYFLTSATY